MAATTQDVRLTSESGWTQITTASTTTVTVQNRGPAMVEILATATAVAPSASTVGMIIPPAKWNGNQTAYVNLTLAQMFPGVATPTQLYARVLPAANTLATSSVFISHA